MSNYDRNPFVALVLRTDIRDLLNMVALYHETEDEHKQKKVFSDLMDFFHDRDWTLCYRSDFHDISAATYTKYSGFIQLHPLLLEKLNLESYAEA